MVENLVVPASTAWEVFTYPLNEFVVNIPGVLYFMVGIIGITTILIVIGYALGRNSKGLPFQAEPKPKVIDQKDIKDEPTGDIFNDAMKDKEDDRIATVV